MEESRRLLAGVFRAAAFGCGKPNARLEQEIDRYERQINGEKAPREKMKRMQQRQGK